MSIFCFYNYNCLILLATLGKASTSYYTLVKRKKEMSQDDYYLSQIVVSRGDTGCEEEAQHLTQMGSGIKMASGW